MFESREAQLCPHCAKPLQPVRYGIAVSAMAIRILDALDAAGPRGVSAADLFQVAYGNRGAKFGSLRSYVNALNRALAPSGVAIRSDRFVYRIVGQMRQRA